MFGDYAVSSKQDTHLSWFCQLFEARTVEMMMAFFSLPCISLTESTLTCLAQPFPVSRTEK
jgi:hypothetical protein